MNTIRRCIIATTIGPPNAILVTIRSLAHTKKTHSFSIIPQQASSKLARLSIAILKHVSAKLIHTIAFLDLSASTEGKVLLKFINFKAIQNAANEDWDDVRALRADLLPNLIKMPGK